MKINVDQSLENRDGIKERQAGLRDLTDIKLKDLVSRIYGRGES